MFSLAVVGFALAISVTGSQSAAHEWTDQTGRHRVEAEYVDLKDGEVVLRKSDGKTVTVPLDRLSEADRRFVRAMNQKDSSTRGKEEFTFHDLTVTILDSAGNPVEGALVKAYSLDWPVAYPQNWFLSTNGAGQTTFHLPRGTWKIIAGKHDNPGLFLTGELRLEATKSASLRPNHAIEIRFVDRAGTPSDADVVYVAPSSMVPNCLMPMSGRIQDGRCVILTNAREKLAYFLARSPTPTREGYFLYADGFRPTRNVAINATRMDLNHIHFDGHAPDDTPGKISWILCFPYQDVERKNWHTEFWLEEQGNAYTNIDYIEYYPRSLVWSEELRDDVWYNFAYRPIDFETVKSVAIAAGGPLTPSFHYMSFRPHCGYSAFVIGPTYDAYGNELRFHAPKTAERFGIPLRIQEYSDGPVLYDEVFRVASDNLASRIDQRFPETAVFRLEWNQPGHGGRQTIQGAIGDPNYRYEYNNVSTPHFEIHAPAWMPEKAEQLGVQWEKAYAVMVDLIGSAPPLTPEKNFYIDPTGLGAGGLGQQLYYHGFVCWDPRSPCDDWEAGAFHEIGHRMQSELFNQGEHRFPLEHDMNEAVAEMISHYTVAHTHGPEFARYHLSDRTHRFLAYMDDPKNAPNPAWHNLFFFLEVYLTKQHGWEINKRFYRTWIDACVILHPLGYNQKETFAALYSVLAQQDLTWMFRLCGFELDDGRMLEARSQIEHLGTRR